MCRVEDREAKVLYKEILLPGPSARLIFIIVAYAISCKNGVAVKAELIME